VRYANRDATGAPIELKDGENLSGVEIILGTDVGTVKGKVSGIKADAARALAVLIPTGKPLLSALRFSRQSIVGKDGGFEIKAAPGEYFIVYLNTDDSPKTESKFEEWLAERTKNAEKVTVKAGETTTVSIAATGN
jgi:hypothetical protein